MSPLPQQPVCMRGFAKGAANELLDLVELRARLTGVPDGQDAADPNMAVRSGILVATEPLLVGL